MDESFAICCDDQSELTASSAEIVDVAMALTDLDRALQNCLARPPLRERFNSGSRGVCGDYLRYAELGPEIRPVHE